MIRQHWPMSEEAHTNNNYYNNTVVSQVSTHAWRLNTYMYNDNITRNFGLHGRLLGIKIPYVWIKVATVTVAP